MTDANYILTKLNNLDDSLFTSWSDNDKRSMLEIYLLLSIHESRLLDLLYSYQNEDSDLTPKGVKVNGIKCTLDKMRESNL